MYKIESTEKNFPIGSPKDNLMDKKREGWNMSLAHKQTKIKFLIFKNKKRLFE